ncbi:hypothetical protein ACFQ9X_15870 [Catenulispora yoronensis]
MDVSTASATRYATDEYVATYLHAEWWDLLFPADGTGAGIEPRQARSVSESGPGSFYRQLGEVVERWVRGLAIDAAALCDVGGSTGRMTHELAARFPDATERMLVEPSSRFCQWAARLLLHETFDGWVPEPADSGRPGYRKLDRDRLPVVTPFLSIHNTTAAGVPRPQEHFDVVTCLNVVDRVEDPGSWCPRSDAWSSRPACSSSPARTTSPPISHRPRDG